MLEKHIPVTIEVARAYCDNSSHCTHIESELKFTGIMLPVNPPLYEYKCENCGKVENLRNHYPHLIYNGASSL